MFNNKLKPITDVLLALEIGNNHFENIKKILAKNSFLIVDTFKNIDQDVRCLISTKLWFFYMVDNKIDIWTL